MMDENKCPHKGWELQKKKCELCGDIGKVVTIHSCAIHGTCTQRKYKTVKEEEQICIGCPDGPWSAE